MIIDTHLHLIDPSALRYPWLAGVPALKREFSLEEYSIEARRAGIAAALHMEVDVDPADITNETLRVKQLAAQKDSLLQGAIVACRPEDAGFADYLETLADDPFIKGLRRVFHAMPQDFPEGALFRENIQRLGATSLTFDLCVLPRQMAQAMALVDLAPAVTFVLDHCGIPDIKGEGWPHWHGQIAEMARRPNVVAKISGLVAYADAASWQVATLQPYVEHTIRHFGWDRVVWGSDWPVCTLGGGLLAWVAATHALIAACSRDERDKLLSGNAKKLWLSSYPQAPAFAGS